MSVEKKPKERTAGDVFKSPLTPLTSGLNELIPVSRELTPVKKEVTRNPLTRIGPIVAIKELLKKTNEKDSEKGKSSHMDTHFRLVQAYQDGTPIVHGWRRGEEGGDIQLYVGGSALLGNSILGENRIVNDPPGAKGKELTPAEVQQGLDEFEYWKPIRGERRLFTEEDLKAMERISFDDGLLKITNRPFAYMVLAEPVPPEEVTHHANTLHTEVLRAKNSRSPKMERKGKELEFPFQESKAGEKEGYWQFSIYVGAKTEADVTSVSQTIAGSANSLPFTMYPNNTTYSSFSEAVAQQDPTQAMRAGTPTLAALTAVPKKEIPGIRMVEHPTFFTVAPERPKAPEDEIISMGTVLNEGMPTTKEFELSLDDLNRHVLITGKTGAGKSETTRALLTKVSQAEVPWLVIDPVKTDYRVMGDRLRNEDIPEENKDVHIIRLGESTGLSLGLDALAPQPGFPKDQHIGMIKKLFKVAFTGEEPFPQVMSDALDNLYGKHWDIDRNKSHYPNEAPAPEFVDLQKEAEKSVVDAGYGDEVKGNVSGFMKVRLKSLRTGTAGKIFNSPNKLDIGEVLSRNCVIELGNIKDPREKAFINGVLLLNIVEYLETRPDQKGLSNFVLLEEAHNIFKASTEPLVAEAVEAIANMVAEVRDKGVGIGLVDQRPSSLHESAIANTDVKLVHNLPHSNDYTVVGEAMGLDKTESQFATGLDVGEVMARRGNMKKPARVQMPDPRKLGNSKEYIAPPEKILKPHPAFKELPDTDTLAEAKRFLEGSTLNARRIKSWAEFSVISQLKGYGAVQPDRDIQHRTGKPFFAPEDIEEASPKALEYSMGLAVTDAVDSRLSVILPHMDRNNLIEYVSQSMYAQLEGIDMSKEHEVSLILPEGKYSKVETDLMIYITENYQERNIAEGLKLIENFIEQTENPPSFLELAIESCKKPDQGIKGLVQALGIPEEVFMQGVAVYMSADEETRKRMKSPSQEFQADPNFTLGEKIGKAIERIENQLQQQQEGENEVTFKDLVKEACSQPENIKGLTELLNLDPETFIDVAQQYVVASNEQKEKMKTPTPLGRHPDTEQWEQTYGHSFPGNNAIEQIQPVAKYKRTTPHVDQEELYFPRNRQDIVTMDELMEGSIPEYIERREEEKWENKFVQEHLYAFAMHNGAWSLLQETYRSVIRKYAQARDAQEKDTKKEPGIAGVVKEIESISADLEKILRRE